VNTDVVRNFMKTFIADIIPKIQRFSKKLDDITLLTNQHWVSLSDILNSKTVYIFRPNNQLLVSENGLVQKGTWEYLGNQSLLLDTNSQCYLLKQGFFDENVMALKLDSSDQFAFFVNETKFDRELNNINDVLEFLTNKYLRNNTTGESSKVKFPQKDKLGNVIIPRYSEGQPIEHFQLLESNFYTIIITFENGVTGTLFKRKSDNKYYYFDSKKGIKYFFDKHSCIKEMYIDIIEK
jgi:hypothetical protein